MGYAATAAGISEMAVMKGIICSAPKPQLNPTERGWICDVEVKNAAADWPDSVRPFSVRVTESDTGRRRPQSVMARRAANMAAFAFRPSNMVSSNRRSTPPSISALICV